MIVLVRDDESAVVSPISAVKYLNDGYRIDIEDLKNVYVQLNSILKKEISESLLASNESDVEVIKRSYEYFKILKMILDGTVKNYNVSIDEMQLFMNFVSYVEKLKRLRATKILKMVLIKIQGNDDLILKRLGKR